MSLLANQILVPSLGSDFFDCPQRILSVDPKKNEIWCIGLLGHQTNGHVKGYVRGPHMLPLSSVESAVTEGLVCTATFNAPGYWSMTDGDYVEEVPIELERERGRRRSRLKKRDQLWAAITPLVSRPETTFPWSCLTHSEVLRQATQHGVSVPTIYRAVHLYWAGGSVMNALIPSTHRCGSPGTQRSEYKCRAPHARSLTGRVPYVLSKTDKERLALGYMLISPERGARAAFLLTSKAFWATRTVDQNGEPDAELFPLDQRPTFEQFRYWGKRLSNHSAKAAQLGFRHPTGPTHRGGSAQDLAVAVGQKAMFDSTSTDVYLTSMRSRLIKLPPMTRSLVMDVRSTLCLGLYCGWDHPSSRTGLRAIYCAATDKVALCKRFGIEIGPDDWPAMLSRAYLADNGELKSASITDAERQIGFSVEYARSYSGSSKGTVETQHHTDHKRVDHRLPGTTHGRPHRRGKPHPADAALLNYCEYMGVLIRWILDYNREEVPKLAPTEMRNAGLRPTRINIFKWLRDHGQRADIPCDLDQLRALALPQWDAKMQYNGIILKTADGKRDIAGARFFCEELRSDPRFIRANRDRQVIEIKVRFEPENFAEVWLPTSRGLLRVPNQAMDTKAQREDTLADMDQRRIADAPARELRKAECDQHDLNEILRRETVTDRARRELNQELAQQGKRISKAAQRANLRQNAVDEQRLVERLEAGGEPSLTTISNTPAALAPPAGDAAELAVVAFLAKVGGSDVPK